MQYKNTKKIMLDQRKLETLFRIGCPDNLIIELLKTGTFTPTGDSLIDDNLETLIDHKIFNNEGWGGKREGAGAPKGNTNAKKNNQNNQDNNQDYNQDNNQDTDKDIDIYNNSRNNIYNNNTTCEENNQNDNQIEKKAKAHNMLELIGNAYKATDAVVGVFDRPDGTTREGIRIKNPRLMAFVRQRFDREVLNKVSDWAIDHNQRGHTYNATALLKLLCKFQSNVEPDINFNHVQSEYLTFEYKGENK